MHRRWRATACLRLFVPVIPRARSRLTRLLNIPCHSARRGYPAVEPLNPRSATGYLVGCADCIPECLGANSRVCLCPGAPLLFRPAARMFQGNSVSLTLVRLLAFTSELCGRRGLILHTSLRIRE
ncbi:uncharacterized protein ASPGLDRAFT_1214491 [Aspergillus glaucus CBS 516.65]|uniref:Uncharacterized protein n=1 Tax=Aspergillus glaucus CBS 516.65 TaxID=1160497 RepID=A0A1L9VQZ2_ASPGL|nr:hypothetical protein ASPGLDRAFT_1214491 [Aspergillus glaucus CBS 516.65]OJJ86327.1 hypothetical protein ASPGLDRAFT_1214491 [Aspergillus glaucus CBS 516.65]